WVAKQSWMGRPSQRAPESQSRQKQKTAIHGPCNLTSRLVLQETGCRQSACYIISGVTSPRMRSSATTNKRSSHPPQLLQRLSLSRSVDRLAALQSNFNLHNRSPEDINFIHRLHRGEHSCQLTLECVLIDARQHAVG